MKQKLEAHAEYLVEQHQGSIYNTIVKQGTPALLARGLAAWGATLNGTTKPGVPAAGLDRNDYGAQGLVRGIALAARVHGEPWP